MAKLQADIEDIQAQNQMLEQDFENEINKKNTSMKEVGQVMNSIENIYKVACDLARDRNRPNLP